MKRINDGLTKYQRHYKKHRAERLAYCKQYAKEHPEERKANGKRFKANHPGYSKMYRDKEYSRDVKAAWLREAMKRAKERAKRKGIPFDKICIFVDNMPDVCPVLGITLDYSPNALQRKDRGKMLQNRPSLDRIIPANGYVQGNVKVISYRANSIKQDATLEELEAVYDYVRCNRGNS